MIALKLLITAVGGQESLAVVKYQFQTLYNDDVYLFFL